MNESYNTKQRDILLSFLSCNYEKLYTVSELVDNLKDSGISKSSIYRNLDNLLSHNLIKKVIVGSSKSISYKYIDNHCKGVIHLCCSNCNKMIHVDEELSKFMLSHYGFNVDKDKTVIYGLCNKCGN